MPVVYTTNKLPQRAKLDTYITPRELALAVSPGYALGIHQVLDPGAGTGVWGQIVKQVYPRIKLTGVEIRNLKCPPRYDHWIHHDFLSWYPIHPIFDLVIGNPPYQQAEAFVRHAFEVINSHGTILFLLPTHFLHGEKRGLNLFSDLTPHRVITLMQRPNFKGKGKANPNTYVLVEWKANYDGLTYHNWLNWKPVDKSPGRT